MVDANYLKCIEKYSLCNFGHWKSKHVPGGTSSLFYFRMRHAYRVDLQLTSIRENFNLYDSQFR